MAHKQVRYEDIEGLDQQDAVHRDGDFSPPPELPRHLQHPQDSHHPDDAPDARDLACAGGAAVVAHRKHAVIGSEGQHHINHDDCQIHRKPSLAVVLDDLPAPQLDTLLGAVLVAGEEGPHEVGGPVDDDDLVHRSEDGHVIVRRKTACQRNEDGVVQEEKDTDGGPGDDCHGVGVQDAAVELRARGRDDHGPLRHPASVPLLALLPRFYRHLLELVVLVRQPPPNRPSCRLWLQHVLEAPVAS
mmetsp:Transcript_78235/g.229285  ORF Transcript_78235/g.229285 Transcript_78235/m.229285 type:complete len:244 (-) Transcript_78235:262-993(-)